jgi:formylglycine-generating enzyme required for sulfatase activity
MQAFRPTLLVLVTSALTALAGCPRDPAFIECRDVTSCERFPGGVCLENPATGHQFCTYPDTQCPSGTRWSDLDVEDSISGMCVVIGQDAGVDAMPIDAAVDALPSPDAMTGEPGMVIVPAGIFLRGCNAATGDDCTGQFLDELPYSEITLTGFWIDETEVTQAAYKLCVDAAACTNPSGNYNPVNRPTYPVSNVTWQQSVDFCTWAGKRLPTEAEWEKAARGTDGRKYPWGNLAPTCDRAHYLDCVDGSVSAIPVGSKPQGNSQYGARDMGGNVLEWVNDWYSNQYYQLAPAQNPPGPTTGTWKVDRGGSWGYGIGYLRTSDRYNVMPTTALDQQGFRCAKDE